jgi:hypothetical protein
MEWQTIRVFRTVPGDHLLEDAWIANPERYGCVTSLANHLAVADTGVRISDIWDTLSLSQSGRRP